MSPSKNSMQRWRSSTFTASWLLYAGYYLCRENLRVARLLPGIPFLDGNLSQLLTAFAFAYIFGHGVAGAWADSRGPRAVALTGGLISAAATGAMLGVHTPHGMLVLQMLNGFGQGMGFPALARLLAVWFHRQERPGILAWWSASYSVGGVLAASLTFWCATTTVLLPSWGWRRCLMLPPLLLAGIALFFYHRTRDNPQQAGLTTIADPSAGTPGLDSSGWTNGWWSVLANGHIRTISAMYFFLKMTRYALLFWLPIYLVQTTHTSEWRAAATASCFELFGFAGALMAVQLSARYFAGRRYPVAALLLFAVGILALLEPIVAPLSWWTSAINMALMGMLVYAVDALMVSVAVLETVPQSHSARAIATVNGIGSVGQMLAPLLVTGFAHRFGWENLFNLFLITSLMAAGIVAARWNEEPGLAAAPATT